MLHLFTNLRLPRLFILLTLKKKNLVALIEAKAEKQQIAGENIAQRKHVRIHTFHPMSHYFSSPLKYISLAISIFISLNKNFLNGLQKVHWHRND